MKKNKKNLKGMTLVEVIVAMTIFAISFAAVLTILSGAFQQTVRNRKRDIESGDQAAAIGKKSDQDLTQVGSSTFQINYSGGGYNASRPVTLFQANQQTFNQDFGFQYKTFQNATLEGLDTSNNNADEYKFVVINPSTSTDTITIRVTIATGTIYEGNYDSYGYIHPSKVYTRTVEPGKSINFGYKNDAYSSTDLDLKIIHGTSETAATINPNSFISGKREVDITYLGTGVNTVYPQT